MLSGLPVGRAEGGGCIRLIMSREHTSSAQQKQRDSGRAYKLHLPTICTQEVSFSFMSLMLIMRLSRGHGVQVGN